MNKYISKVSLLMIILTLLISPLSSVVSAQEPIDNVGKEIYIGQFNDDTELYYLEGYEPIIANKDSRAFFEKVNEEIFIQINNESIPIEESRVTLEPEAIVKGKDKGYLEYGEDLSKVLTMQEINLTNIDLEIENAERGFSYTIPENSLLTVMGERENFYEVVIGNMKAEVKKDLLIIPREEETEKNETIKVEDSKDITEEVSEEQEEQEEQEPDESEDSSTEVKSNQENEKKAVITSSANGKYFISTIENQSIYIKENGHLKEVGKLVQNQVYTKKADYGNWIIIQFGKKEAFIYKSTLKFVSSDKKASLESINAQNLKKTIDISSNTTVYDNKTGELVPFLIFTGKQTFPLVSDYGKWNKINVLGRTGYVKKTSSPPSNQGNYFTVNNNGIPVYVNNKGSLEKVGELTKGQVYENAGNYGNWIKVNFSNGLGFVYKEHINEAFFDNNASFEKTNSTTKRFTTLNNVPVYDNKTGKLVPFFTFGKNVSYPITSDYGNWYKVSILGRTGYVHKGNVTLGTGNTQNYFQVTEDNLAIFLKKNGKLVKAGSLKKGETFKRVKDYGNWHQINFSEQDAFVYKKGTVASNGNLVNIPASSSDKSAKMKIETAVYKQGKDGLIQVGTIEKGVSYKINRPYGNWLEINYLGVKGYIYKSNTEIEFDSKDKYYKVLEEGLPVYENKNGNLLRIGSLQKGQVYKREQDYGNWHKINIGKTVAFVYKASTEPASVNEFKNSVGEQISYTKQVTTNKSLGVREKETNSSSLIGEIASNQTIHVIKETKSWYQVNISGKIGYVSKTSVEKFMYIRITKDNAYVYQPYGDVNVAKGVLVKGQVFPLIEELENSYLIQFGDGQANVKKTIAYPYTDTISLPLYDVREKPTLEFISSKDITVYDNSGKELKPFAVIKGKVNYPILSDYGNWYRLSIGGRIGFIRKNNDLNVSQRTSQDSDLSFYRNVDKNSNMQRVNSFINTNPQIAENELMKLVDNNQYRIHPYGTYSFKNEIDWVKNPTNTRSYYRSLHSLNFLSDYVEAYKLSGNMEYINKSYSIINQWYKKNPLDKPSHIMAWHDETTGLRLELLIYYFHETRHVLTDEQLSFLYNLIVEHAALLANDDFHTEKTNHGMFQDEALLIFSDYFNEYKLSTFYSSTAKDRLKEYFDYIISKDGVHKEHSPSYNQLIASSINAYANYFEKRGDISFENYLRGLYVLMSDYATYVIKPDGTLPMIGDTFGKDRPNTSLWTDNEQYQYAASGGANGTAPFKNDVVYPDGGYAIFRDGWSSKANTYVHFTAAYHTDYHKHSDDLSVYIYHDGDVITEAGPNGYDYNSPYTEYAYSSFAHNTLIVDDNGLPRVDGKYNKTSIIDYKLSDNSPSVTGKNDRYDGVSHTRNLTYKKELNEIIVSDTISSNQSHNYKLLWHFAKDIKPIIQDNIVKLYRGDELIMEIELSSNQPLTISSVYGQENPVLGWHFKDVNNYDPTYVITVDTNSEDAKITTKFTVVK
ncbi:heparinase II/III family protein [Bacillus sp. J37]|uniref:heparinase II/III domain-containing protein n=1 Tax=Bacillus sp. J37 TaxID=935837 RepID=UPI0004BB8C1D|nr:heparinase II/III family protein [Bacillus sp. J37]